MFKSKVVFVLGAGASAEVGMPVGSMLREQIAQKLKFPAQWQHWPPSGVDEVLARAMLRRPGSQIRGSMKPYYEVANLIRNAMSQASSIDDYLESKGGEDLIAYVGKLAIARCIHLAEADSKLHFSESGEFAPFFNGLSKTWYARLAFMLQIRQANVELIFDNVSFIDFNYDRCLEQFLLLTLRNVYELSEDDAAELVGRATIIHPYGSLGRLPAMASAGVGFGDHADDDLNTMASRIRTYSEQVEDESVIDQIATVLDEADKVVFLGCALHEQNTRLLGLKADRNKRSEVFATVKGVEPPNLRVRSNQLQEYLGVANLITVNGSCAVLLDSYRLDIEA